MSFTQKDLDPLVRGDDWNIRLTITSGGSPVDISGFTYYMTLKSNVSNPDPGDLQVIATPTGTDAQNGILYITASRTDTSTLSPANYNYDIQQEDLSNNVRTLLIGKVKVVADITRTV